MWLGLWAEAKAGRAGCGAEWARGEWAKEEWAWPKELGAEPKGEREGPQSEKGEIQTQNLNFRIRGCLKHNPELRSERVFAIRF